MRWKLRLVWQVAAGEGNLLPGCGWTQLTASIAASQAYRRPELRCITRSNTKQANVNAEHTLSCAFCGILHGSQSAAAHSDGPVWLQRKRRRRKRWWWIKGRRYGPGNPPSWLDRKMSPCIRPHFDQSCRSLSLAVAGMVELCVRLDSATRKIYGCIYSLAMIYFMSGH